MGKPRTQIYFLFRLGIFLIDLVSLVGAFWVATQIVGMPYTPGPGWVAAFWPLLFTMFVLCFFPSHDLYSYHLIFSLKKQLRALHIALAWGGAAALLLSAYYTLPAYQATNSIFTLLAIGVALATLAWNMQVYWQALPHFLRAFGISLIAVWATYYLFDGKEIYLPQHIWIAPLGLLFSSAVLSIGRYLLIEYVYNNWLYRSFRRQVGIVGTSEDAEDIISHVIDNNAPFWIAGTIGCDTNLSAQSTKKCLGDIIEIPIIFDEHQLNDVIVTDESIDKRTLISLLDFAMAKGITVWFPPKVLPVIDRKTYIDNFCGIPMIRMGQEKRYLSGDRIKYMLDALMTLPLIIAILPLFILVAAAIKLNSAGPIFYMADAIGKNGEPFKMFKFRSMRINTDNQVHKQFVTKLIQGDVSREDTNDKPLKIVDDHRVTAVGAFIRKYSIDELPQLLNVLSGDMSLIGPRPCLPYEYDVYQDWHKKRAAIRPGITGLWQVAGRSEVTFEEMVLLDLFYVYNRSLWLDTSILVETIFVVLTKKGAY